MMDEELEDMKKGTIRKIVELLNSGGNKTILVRMFDALAPVSDCPCGCDTHFSSPSMPGMQMVMSELIEKYGRNKFKLELRNVLEPSIKKFNGVYTLFKERGGNALPIISINGKIRFIGRTPSLEEFEGEIKAIT